MSRFSFTGEFAVPKDKSLVEDKTSSSGSKFTTLNGSVVAAKNNRTFVSMTAFAGNVGQPVKFFNQDGEQCEVEWSERLDEDILKSARGKIVISLGDNDRHEFLTEYDALNFIRDNADAIVGKKVTVSGQVRSSIYKGKVNYQFNVKNIYVVDEDRKNGLIVNDVLFYDKDSVDVVDFAEDKKVFINGYSSQFVDKKTLGEDKGANRYLPFQAIIDASRMDFENEKHVALFKLLLSGLGLEYVDGKVKVSSKIKSGKYYKNAIEYSLFNGNEEEEFSYDLLTDFQKLQVDLGIRTVESYRPVGQSYGNRITEYRIKSYDARDDFADGFIEADPAKEFEELILSLSTEEKLSDVISETKAEEPKKEETKSVDDQLADLFG